MLHRIVILGVVAVALAACGGGSAEDVSADDQDVVKATFEAQLKKATQAMTGESTPSKDKAYWLLGTNPSNKPCNVLIARTDGIDLQVSVDINGTNPNESILFDIFKANPGMPQPKILFSQTSGLVQSSVVDQTVNGSTFTNSVEAHFTGAGGYEGLTSVRVFSDTGPDKNGAGASHVEEKCSGLTPFATFDAAKDGPAAAAKAKAFWEAKSGKKIKMPYNAGCGFDAGHLTCSFMVGNGDDAHDIPPDQLEATFEVTGGKLGNVLKASYDGSSN
jgi:hypothetical protein